MEEPNQYLDEYFLAAAAKAFKATILLYRPTLAGYHLSRSQYGDGDIVFRISHFQQHYRPLYAQGRTSELDTHVDLAFENRKCMLFIYVFKLISKKIMCF